VYGTSEHGLVIQAAFDLLDSEGGQTGGLACPPRQYTNVYPLSGKSLQQVRTYEPCSSRDQNTASAPEQSAMCGLRYVHKGNRIHKEIARVDNRLPGFYKGRPAFCRESLP
jgi:hypothetical protein